MPEKKDTDAGLEAAIRDLLAVMTESTAALRENTEAHRRLADAAAAATSGTNPSGNADKALASGLRKKQAIKGGEAAPAQSETEAAQPETDAAPAKTDAAPAKTDAAPAKTEAAQAEPSANAPKKRGRPPGSKNKNKGAGSGGGGGAASSKPGKGGSSSKASAGGGLDLGALPEGDAETLVPQLMKRAQGFISEVSETEPRKARRDLCVSALAHFGHERIRDIDDAATARRMFAYIQSYEQNGSVEFEKVDEQLESANPDPVAEESFI